MTVLLPRAVDRPNWPTADWRLGAHVVDGENAVVFAVFAPAATAVRLELFSRPTGKSAFATFDMAKSETDSGGDGVWRAKVGTLAAGAHYGFRCWGPNWPQVPDWEPGTDAGFIADMDEHGNRFNPNKVLFDPYGREMSHPVESTEVEAGDLDAGAFGTGGQDYRGRPRRVVDTARIAPKSIVVDDATPTGTRPRIPAEDAIIYEAHVKSMTQHSSSARLSELLAGEGFDGIVDVPEELRGTYAGLALMVPYLKGIGVTTVELLPVHQSASNSGPGRSGVNYWGYQTLGYFAPHRAYAYDQSPGGPTREFKQMVAAFHDAGMEVYLDVVYNHTGEGGHWAGDLDTIGLVSFGGFATAEYYSMTDELRLVDGATGCSNQLNFSRSVTRQLVLDSLAYWADVMGVDGYRFDLAPVLGRRPDAADREDWEAQRRFDAGHPLLGQIVELAQQRHLEVIAEAWDLWGFEVGNFPDGWAEWNGRYRDAMRDFLRGMGSAQAFMAMMNGDFDHFADQGGPQQSVNFLTAHDGFTLADLMSYNEKSNGHPYPFGPSDGGNDSNSSWDSGGDAALRRQRIRNAIAVLMLSRGVPMIVAGDEYGRTQNGNNNPWAIDSVGVWNNWAQVVSHAPHQAAVDPDQADADAHGAHYHDNLGVAPTGQDVNPVFRFAVAMMRLRHEHPALRQRHYGDDSRGGDDVSYLFRSVDGHGDPEPHARALEVFIDAAGAASPDSERANDLLVLINMWHDDVEFALPAPHTGKWRRIADTAARSEEYCNAWAAAQAQILTDSHTVPAWSVTVLRGGGGV